jgi:hypothetical protein
MEPTCSEPLDRTGWPQGPWDQEPDRVEWYYRDTPCLAMRNKWGVWCGYAGVRPGHPLHGMPYQVARDLVEVHGGLTYSDACQGDVCHTPAPGDTPDIWWFGFDCGHAFDLSPGMEAFLRRLDSNYSPFGTYRDLDFVKAEVQAMVRQIHDI